MIDSGGGVVLGKVSIDVPECTEVGFRVFKKYNVNLSKSRDGILGVTCVVCWCNVSHVV
jgi:hypothetical protein